MNNRLKKLKWNSILALSYQIILIFTGFLLPRFFLKFYGSEVYGLITSITQFLSFINLCDMGIGAVVSSALYKPLAYKDKNSVSGIIVYARKYFRFISYILLTYIVILVLVYPRIVADSFNLSFTIVLLLAMSISQFAQYFIGITYQILLNADQRSYVQLIINSSTLLINTITTIVIMNLGGSIHLVKFLTSLIYLLRPLLMYIYVKKKYDIDYSVTADDDVIPQKWNGVIQHISYMIYENTDVMILTLFSSLSNVCIYSVYVLVVNSLKSFINAATTGMLALFGNMIANGEEYKLKKTYDIYDWLIHTTSTLLFTITGILIVPFVLIYTSDINDANYNVPLFATMITIVYAINVIRNGMYVIVKSVGHYKQTQRASMMEAMLNLGTSIILVFNYGLIGVAIGTLISTSFFVIYEVYYFSKNVLFRSVKKFVRQLSVDIVQAFILVLATKWLNVANDSYFNWIGSAIVIGIICFVICILIQIIFYKSNLLIIIKYLQKYIVSAKY